MSASRRCPSRRSRHERPPLLHGECRARAAGCAPRAQRHGLVRRAARGPRLRRRSLARREPQRRCPRVPAASAATSRTRATPGQPRPPRALPGPVAYWVCTAVVFVLASAVLIPAASLVRTPSAGSPRRRRLGVDAQARFARHRELAPLIVPAPQTGPLRARPRRPPPRRHRTTPPTLSDEHRPHADVAAGTAHGPAGGSVLRPGGRSHPLRQDRQRDRRHARVVGPRDPQLGQVRPHRRHLRPTRHASAKYVSSTRPTAPINRCAGWSPLRAANTLTGAQKAARALTDAGPRRGADSLDFFLSLAEQLLWPLLWVAAISEHTMRDVVRWVLTQDCPTASDIGEVAPILDAQLYHPDPTRQIEAAYVFDAIQATWNLDERTRSNVYATVQTLVARVERPDRRRIRPHPGHRSRLAPRRREHPVRLRTAARTGTPRTRLRRPDRRSHPTGLRTLRAHQPATATDARRPRRSREHADSMAPRRRLDLRGHRPAAGHDLAVEIPDRRRLRAPRRLGHHQPRHQDHLLRRLRPRHPRLRRPAPRRRRDPAPLDLTRPRRRPPIRLRQRPLHPPRPGARASSGPTR